MNKLKIVEIGLISSGVFFSIFHILSAVGITKLIPILPEITKLNVFSTLGNSLNSIMFLISLLPFTIYKIINTKDLANKILLSLASFIVFIGLTSLGYQTFIKNGDNLQILKLKYG